MKLNGFRPSHRNRWLLLKNKVLTRPEFLLLEYYIDLMDFDSSHEAFGTFKVNFSEATKILNYNSSNSARLPHKKLLKSGIISPTENKHVYRINNPERYVPETQKWKGLASTFATNEKNQSCSKIFQNIGTNIQFNEQKVQPIEKNTPIKLKENSLRHLSSSKGKYLSDKEKQSEFGAESIAYIKETLKE